MNLLDITKAAVDSKGRTACILSEKFRVVYSNDQDVFPNAANVFEKFKPVSLPIQGETRLAYSDNGVDVVADITPFQYGHDKYYFVVSLHADDIFAYATNSGDVRSSVNKVVYSMQDGINKIVGLSMLLEKTSPTSDTHTSTAQEIIQVSSKLSVQLFNVGVLFDLESAASGTVCVPETLSAVCSECSAEIACIGRRLTYGSDGAFSVAKISERHFIAVVMNIIQNAFLFSSECDEVNVVSYEQHGMAVIKITNRVLSKEKTSYLSERSGLGLSVARKVIDICGGEVQLQNDGTTFSAEIHLPLAKPQANDNLKLNSSMKEYVTQRFRPVSMFMKEIVGKKSGGAHNDFTIVP
jgi:hypothetical protein